MSTPLFPAPPGPDVPTQPHPGARPDDPLMSARQRAADQAGGNGFMQVAATHAALLLAQGSGRLIRSTSDKGVVAILDPRLATARYGSFLKASLPPMWTAAVASTRPPSTSASFVVPPPMSMLRMRPPSSLDLSAAPEP